MHFLCTLLLCLFSAHLLAQQYIDIPALLTDRTNTQRIGVVRYYDWATNPQTVEFADTGTQIFRTVYIRDIRQLNITGKAVYEGLYLNVPRYAKGPIRFTNELIEHIDSTYYLAERLLESAPVKLYRFLDIEDKDRFVLSKNDSLVLLNDIHTRLEKRGTAFNYSIPEYQTTLKRILYECPTLDTKNTTYTERSLTTLVKEYLTFCRIDAKIHSEQTKPSRTQIGVGVHGSSWRTGDGSTRVYGVSVQLLMPKQFHNKFFLIDLGQASTSGSSDISRIQIGLYGGRYFGKGPLQAKVYTGFSTVLAILDTGLGISYRKMISTELRYPVFAGLFSKFREGNDVYIRPLINLRAIVPLSKREKN